MFGFNHRVLNRIGFALRRWPEPQTLLYHLRWLLSHHAINVVVDVGANRGQYARTLRQVGYKGLIVSFEPVASNVELLRGLARRDRGWIVVPAALGAEESELELSIAEGTDLTSFLPFTRLASTLHGSVVVAKERVPVHRLDNVLRPFVANIPTPRIFLKSDTQGFDLNVLAGSTALFDRVHAIQIEMSLQPLYEGMPDMTTALSHLRDYGYAPSGFFPVVSDGDTGLLIEIDCVALRAGGATGAERSRA